MELLCHVPVPFTRPSREFVAIETISDRDVHIINVGESNRRTIPRTTVQEPSHEQVPTSVREHKLDEQWLKSRNGADEGYV